MTRRVGLWLIGAHGGVGSTTALGLAALAKGIATSNGMVTALTDFATLDFDDPEAFTVGGHDLRPGSFYASAVELHERSNVFAPRLLTECKSLLDDWERNVKPGVAVNSDPAALALAGGQAMIRAATSPQAAIDAIRDDLLAFKKTYSLNDVVVINVASTEPPVDVPSIVDFSKLPTSSLYAWAAVEAGCPYVNLTPSLGGSFPAFEEHCRKHDVPHAGQDAKTGETLIKSVLAPMFAMRNLQVLSWVGHNILGNRDGQVLADPANKQSKLRTKDAILGELLGYKPQSHVSIEHIESLGDWKTAWDHIHFEGFLGTKMTMQFTWQGCDSLLAAPLVIDLARLLLFAKRRGHAGVLPAAACFFKSPLGTKEQDLHSQYASLEQYLRTSLSAT
jgi:myo-inositol-1-phosphate synthase